MPQFSDLIHIHKATVIRGESIALKNFSWTIKSGQHWAVLGPNGSGKSTLVQMLQGWLWPCDGKISVLGRQFGSDDLAELRRCVAWVGSEAELELSGAQSVTELVASGTVGTLGLQFDRPSVKQIRVVKNALRKCGIHHLAHRRFIELSQGQRRLALIARALAMDPKLLLLDEPTAGLDPIARIHFLKHIAKLLNQKELPLVVYITHHLEEVLPGFTHVLLLRQGRCIASGNQSEMLCRKWLEATFGKGLVAALNNSGFIERIRD